MNNIAQKYNRYLVFGFVFAPFVAFFTVKFLNMGFNRTMQAISYIGVFLLLIFRDKRSPIKFPKYLLLYLLFIIYVFYSDLYRLHREFKLMYLFSNPLIGGLNMMFIVENLKIPKRVFIKIMEISKVILILAFFVIIIQQVVDSSFFVNQNLSSLRFITEQGTEKNRLVSIYSWIGGFIIVGFSFTPVFFLVVEDNIKKKCVFIWIIAGLIFAFLSKARWIMINTLFVFVLMYIYQRVKIRFFLKYVMLLPLIVLMTSISLEFIGVNISGIIKERILESDKSDISQTSAGTRVLAFKALNKLYWDHPLFGIGSIKYGMGGTGEQDYKLRSFLRGRSSQMHVGYVSLLYMYGLVGGILFLSFLFLILNKLYQNAKLTDMWAPFFGFLGFALANLTLVTFSVFYMGFIIVLVADKYYSQKLKLNTNRIV